MGTVKGESNALNARLIAIDTHITIMRGYHAFQTMLKNFRFVLAYLNAARALSIPRFSSSGLALSNQKISNGRLILFK